MTATLRLYRAITALLSPAAPALLRRRAARGKEDRGRLDERLGRAASARPEGALVWLHGASVGETQVTLALARELLAARPDLGVLLTTQTRTGAQIAAQGADVLPAGRVLHRYAPLDIPGAAARFLDRWRPDVAAFVESELWPNLILAAEARGIPLALVNARMSGRSLNRWARRAPRSMAALLNRFGWIGAADGVTARGLSALSGRAVACMGNIKLDAPAPKADAAALAQLRMEIGARPVWCAASTHGGEEEVVLSAHAALRHGAPDALLILIPRHPARGDEVEALIRRAGLRVARRTRGEAADGADVYLADTLGEMGTLLRAAPVVLLGGSLVPGIGGHNPAEPLACDAALLSGPHVGNFAELYAELEAAGGAVMADADAMALRLAALIADADARARVVAAGQGVIARAGGACDRTARALLALIDRAEERGKAE